MPIYLNQRSKTLFIFLFIIISSYSSIYACTEFRLIDQSKNSYVGRSMEFKQPLSSDILIVSKDTQNLSYLENKKGFAWKSKYSYLGLTAMGLDIISDGMNEKGLSVAVLWFADVKYPENGSKSSSAIALEDVPAWLLGSFSNVEEVEKALKSKNIYFAPLPEFNGVPPIHLSIYDRSGKGIVVEYINGQMVISENKVGVLTNAPNYQWQLTNLRKYINLSPINNEPVQYGDFTLRSMGQGTGLYGIPGDWTPPSRFVKIAALKQFAKNPKAAKDNIKLAFHLLNTVDIPFGITRTEGDSNYEYTQWTVVKDLKNSILSYRTYYDMDIKTIDLKKELKNMKGKEKRISLPGVDIIPSKYF